MVLEYTTRSILWKLKSLGLHLALKTLAQLQLFNTAWIQMPSISTWEIKVTFWSLIASDDTVAVSTPLEG